MSCTGCGVCAVACSLGCVAMEPNDEGFLYPTVDGARCVDCSKCVESCVADGSDDLRTPQKALLARACASEARRSSSGGIAYVLARMVLDEGGAVVACALDENGVARHRAFDRADDLWRMQGSKYVQSDATAGYELCCERLRQGRRVLYIGMPCQVAAAKRLVGGDSRLLTVDVVCHGVPSPGFWQKDLSFQNDWGRLLNRQTVMFRSSGRRSRSAFELYDDAGGRAVPYELDAFFTLFMRGASFRESCYSCSFARRERAGDLTIGDCASRDRYPGFHPAESLSIVLTNTPAGSEALDALLAEGLIDAMPIDMVTEAKANGQLHAPSQRPPIRDQVYEDLATLPYGEFFRRYRMKPSLGWWAKRALKRLLPVGARVKIRHAVRRVRPRG